MPGGMLTDAIKLDWQPPIGTKRRSHMETVRMITPAYVRLMAQYNAEMNRRLYAAAARLTDAERKADRGAFWQSIHGTLTHILWGDTQWMSRFDAWPKPEVGQKQSAGMVDDFAALQTRRTKADADITAWANRVDDAWLAEDLVWFSGSAGTRDAAAEGTAGGALLQSPDASPRPGARAAHRLPVRTPAIPICSWWCPTRPDRGPGLALV